MQEQHMEQDEDTEGQDSDEKMQIKSNSLVKFEACKVATFSKLKCNTDLNLPPSNWLTNDGYGLKQVAFHPGGFSSFKMANMFLESIGDVDVISDAENIKRILKLPYSQKSVISMIVHRVNNTLLIDEFDIHKYLLRQVNEDWDWLRSFIVENILNCMTEKDRNIFLGSKGASRDVLQKMNLMSKFLYYSIQEDGDVKTDLDAETRAAEEQIINALRQQTLTNVANQPRLPDPETSEHLPKSQQHNRNVIWTFEDIRMLIGTDIPIFGDDNRPCITLRLRDMNKPINVLTGIDYWLDNLMCNVPELIMCYHLDGLVQKYELIKTEDLPHLDDSKFSPRVIRNVAQNVLAFLKSNATKPGHTYWLFKGKNDDVVKLYDLTTLCKDEPTDKNPFTIPVAMLLYTVAKNIRQSTKTMNPKSAGTVRSLLENCIKLLPKEKYPQIVTSSYYMLSDLFVPASIDPKAPNFDAKHQVSVDEDLETSSNYDEEDVDPENEQDEPNYNENKLDHVVKSIKETLTDCKQGQADAGKVNVSPPPLSLTDVIERCSLALNHIASGLSCLQYFDSSEEQKAKEQEKQKRLYEETHPNMANPYQSIPLPYEPIKQDSSDNNHKIKNLRQNKKKFNKQNSADSVKDDMEEAKSLLPLAANQIIEHSWNTHLKLLLYEKAAVTYMTKAENAYGNESYGVALQYFYASIKCHQLIKKYLPDIKSRRSKLLSRAGDCFYQFSVNVDKIDVYLEGFELQSDTDRIIMKELCKEVQEECLPKPSSNVEEILQISCGFYEAACENEESESRVENLRSLAHIKNILGNLYLSQAQVEYEKYLKFLENENSKDETLESSLHYKTLLMKCYDAFNYGISLFEEVEDSTNLILMLANMGKFMRVRAHTALPGEKINDPKLLKTFYTQSINNYQRALGIIGTRKKNPELWEIISWELSSAAFSYAQTLQDYGLKDDQVSREEMEQTVIEALQKALRLCNTENICTRQILYTFRLGLIHHRLGSLYHNNFRQLVDSEETKRKTCLTLCRMHYEKSARIFLNMNEPKEFFEVQLKRVALFEELFENAGTNNQKIKHLLSALELFKESQIILENLQKPNDSNQSDASSQAEILKLLELFEQRLQFCLRTLTKLHLTNASNAKKSSEATINMYKSMFSASLRKSSTINAKELAEHLNAVLKLVSNQLSKR